MFLLLFYFPVVLTFGCFVFGRFFGSLGIRLLICGSMFCCFILSLFCLVDLIFGVSVMTLDLWVWFNLPNDILFCCFGFFFDSLALSLIVLVSFITLLIELYSTQYLRFDAHLNRFLCLLNLFAIFMFVIAASNNFLQFILGWEGVGLVSYLLINFWFERPVANKSALKAIFLNRIGDFGLACAVILVFFLFFSFDFNVINLVLQNEVFYLTDLTLVCFFLVFAIVGKSAQLGLHTWLPDAMEGPTPVSALLHSSTMVVAGVFLVMRFSNLFILCPLVLIILGFFGCLTIFLASCLAVFQFDIKRIIAFSTCSQLGYMLVACSLGNFIGGFFHLVCHAFFKSLLFLCAGCVVHSLAGEQDIRYMGNLLARLPVTGVIMFFASFSLLGLPFLTGYFSKDFLLQVAFLNIFYFKGGLFLVLLFSVSLTAFYSFKLLYFVFIFVSTSRSSLYSFESSQWTVYILTVLFFCSIFSGFFLEDLFVGLNTSLWQTAIFTDSIILTEIEFVPARFQSLPILFCFIGFYLFFFFEELTKGRSFSLLVCKELKTFCWDSLHKFFQNFLILFTSYSILFKQYDRGIFDPSVFIVYFTEIFNSLFIFPGLFFFFNFGLFAFFFALLAMFLFFKILNIFFIVLLFILLDKYLELLNG